MADPIRQPNGSRSFWEAQVAALLAQVDGIEKEFLPDRTPTCLSRRVGLKALARARSDPHFRGIIVRLGVVDENDVSW